VTSRGKPLQEISTNIPSKVAPGPAASLMPAPRQGVDRLIEAIKKECAGMRAAGGPNRLEETPLAPYIYFDQFIVDLMGEPPPTWTECFTSMRVSTAGDTSVTKAQALLFLKSETDEHGLGKPAPANRYVALLSACLLGYDLDKLWLGTALKGFQPDEATFWRALSINI
jgi:hypothetical protein